MNGSSPTNARAAALLRVLRVWHGRIGFAGALLGLLFGATGFLLNHRMAMRIAPGPIEETHAQIRLDSDPASPEAFAAELAKRLGRSAEAAQWRVMAGRPARMEGAPVEVAETWAVQLPSHGSWVQSSYVPGSRVAEVTVQKAGLVEALKHLHKSQSGDTAWILLADAVAGMLVFMSLSGLFLWTRLQGGRVLAAGLVAGTLLLTVLVAARGW